MLTQDERNAIEGLFRRLDQVEQTSAPRDAEAEALIGERIDRQPAAPYYMAQTILVQEHALSMAERRIAELEGELDRGLRSPTPVPQPGPWDRPNRDADGRAGGFLAGAAQTALGVTGGILIGSAIGSMFGVGAATAAEPALAPEPQPDQTDDPDVGDPGDFGDFGGFDMGGDF